MQNQIDLYGAEMWTAYQNHIDQIATLSGYAMADYLYGVNPDLIDFIFLK